MNTQKAPTRLDKFRQNGGPAQLAEILRSPTMIEALAILEEKIEPNDSVLMGIVRDYKDNAPMVISMVHASQAGQRRVLRGLKTLAHPPQENDEKLDTFAAEPFAYIDEKYLDNHP